MKGTKWISFGLALGLVSASAVWTSCNKEPQPEGRTALEHAYECEEVLGPLPRFSCEDAVLVPVTKNGIPLTPEQAGEGETNDPSLCDCPAAFGKACDPGFRVGRYTGLNQDGTPNEDVVFLTNCRDGGLGVIGYKFSTGETCFLHINNETTGAFDLDIPRPGEDDYNNSWQWPNVVAHDNCQNCHMASPFLHSPAVDQLKNPEDTTELLVPITGNGPYSIVGAEFGPLYDQTSTTAARHATVRSAPNNGRITRSTSFKCLRRSPVRQNLTTAPSPMPTARPSAIGVPRWISTDASTIF